jgi:ferredoxin
VSEVVPRLKAIDRAGKYREYRATLARLDFDGGGHTVQVDLANGTKGRGTCLGCHDAPCMMLGPSDGALPEVLSDFPGDPTREICPTRAIGWNEFGRAVVVDNGACIGYGICINRYPYGAISLTAEGLAVVETADPPIKSLLRSARADDRSRSAASRARGMCRKGRRFDRASRLAKRNIELGTWLLSANPW